VTITRRSLAETYAEHDAIIEAAQAAKREATLAYRGQLDALGMDRDNIKAEIEGFKLAYRRKVAIEKKGEDVVEHRDAIADEIFAEITSSAPRATRVAISVPEHDAETGEVIETVIPVSASSRSVEAAASPGDDGVSTSFAGTEGEADRQLISEPVTIPPAGPSPAVVTAAGGGDSADSHAAVPVATIPEPLAVAPANPPRLEAATRKDAALAAPGASNVTVLRTHNPDTHFLNSKGLPRLHGCLNADMCAGSRSKLCFTCSTRHEGPAYSDGAA